jgi:hypothetical protein
MPQKVKSRSSGPAYLMAAGGLLIVGAIAWYLFGIPGSLPQSDVGQANNGVLAVPVVEDNFPNVERISPQDAKAVYDQGAAVFVDVRTPQEYDQGHIASAISIPLLELPDRISELDPNTWIVTY